MIWVLYGLALANVFAFMGISCGTRWDNGRWLAHIVVLIASLEVVVTLILMGVMIWSRN